MGSIEIVTGAAALANVASMPANVLIYGGPGTLKTTDAVEAFQQPDRCTAFMIPCEDGALKIIVSRILQEKWFVPDHPKETVKSWEQMVGTLQWLAENRSRYNAVIIDGLTPFSTNLYRQMQEQLKGNKNQFEVPTRVRNFLYWLREFIRSIGLHSIFIAHPVPPAVHDGIFYPGGFGIQPKTLTDEYFGQLDTVLRTDYLTIPGRSPQRVYYTGGMVWPSELPELSQPPDWRFWRTKNREGVQWAVVPANLRAFLRNRQPPYQGI